MFVRTIRAAATVAVRETLFTGTALCVVALPTAAAQAIESGSLSGRVVDAGTGVRLQGALVEIPELNLRTSVDREGRYRLGFVQAGTYDVVVTYQNRDTIRQSVTINPGSATVVDFEMTSLNEDVVVVRGARPIAGSEAAAFSRQKSSNNLINVVASDTIGRFPDQNVAAALSRLPGISVERDQGQERYVNLRGAPNKWTTISFNGLNVISPEGRSSRFDTIPNAIVSSIEVTKAVTADMQAESIAGNVNIITRNPFDRSGLHFNGEAAGGVLALGGGSQTNLAAAVSNTFNDDKMGFVLSATWYQRNQVTDNIENRFERPGEAEGDNDLIWSRGTDVRVYHLVRENTGLTGRFDYRPNDNTELFISSIFTEFTDHENRDQFIFDYDSDAPDGCYAITAAPCNNNPVDGVVYGTQIDATFNTNNYKENIWTSTVGGDHFVNGWDMAWRANYTETEDEFFAPARFSFSSPSAATERPSVRYNYADPDLPVTLLFETIDNGDGTYDLGDRIEAITSDMLVLNQIEEIDRMERTHAWAFKFDAERDTELFNRPFTFKTGFQFDRRLKKGRRTDVLFDGDRDDAIENGVDPLIYDQFNPTFADIQRREAWPSDFPAYFLAFRYSDEAAVDIFQEIEAAGATYVQPDESEESFYDVEEEILAAYVMGTMDFDWGNVVAGVRVERSENSGTALGQIDGGAFEEFTAGDDRIDVFPSLHANWDLTDNQKIRLSLNSGLARADFDQRAPNFSINDDGAGEGTISGGNPFVDPEKTYGVDLYYEYYLQPLGIFSVGGFYKYIQDPLVNSNTVFGSTQFDQPGFPRSEYEFNTIVNGEDGFYRGVEMTYAQQFAWLPELTGLPQWTDGFGFNGNIVYVDSEITLPENLGGRDVPIEGASELTYNVSGYWENYGLSLRVNWQWRTDWINAYGSTEEFDRYWDQLGRLSFGARYQVNDNFELFFDANNLTDQYGRRIRQNSTRVYEVEGFGARYLMGVRANF